MHTKKYDHTYPISPKPLHILKKHFPTLSTPPAFL